MNAFAEVMRHEVASIGIRVTIVEPGATTTEVAASIPDPEDRAHASTSSTLAGC